MLHRFVRELARGFDGDDTGVVAEWPLGRTLLVVGLLACALPLSVIARLHGVASMPASLALTAAVLAAFAGVLWPLLAVRAPDGVAFKLFALVAGAASVLALAVLWAGPFDGMPACTGASAANDLRLQRGMTAHDATAQSLAMLLRIGELQGNRIAYLSSVSASVVLGVVAVFASTEPPRRRVAITATTLSFLLPGGFLALPLLHRYQCDGFLAQVFALVPIALGLSAYAVTTRRSMRVVALVVMVVGCRYSYVLNLGDLLLACAAASVLEARDAPGERARTFLKVGAAGFAAASVVAYRSLYPIVLLDGGFAALRLWPQVLGLLALAMVFGALILVPRRFGTPCTPPAERLAAMMAVLCGLPAALLAVWLLAGKAPTYYAQKYGFCAIVLGSLTAPPLIASGLARLATSDKARLVRAALALAGVSGLFALATSIVGYWPSLVARLSRPPSAMGAVRDRAVWSRIDTVLTDNDARFGGFLTPRWSESHFTNTHFRLPDPVAIFDGRTTEAPRHCVFWYAPDTSPGYPASARTTIDRLLASSPATCETMRPGYDAGSTLSLCHHCVRGGARALAFNSASAEEGFHAIERSPEGTLRRWTNGFARVRFVGSAFEVGRVCSARVATQAGGPFELLLDGVLLGPGPEQRLPALREGIDYELQIRSATFVPGRRGQSGDDRTLGVCVVSAEISCSGQ